VKTIISLRSLAYISLRSTFSGTSSYCKFGIIAKPIVDVMNEALYSNRLKVLHNLSPYLEYYEDPEILPDDLPFTEASLLLFDIPLYNDCIVNLYINNYISICLNKVIDGVHEAKRLFNIITNTFNLFFSSTIDNIPKKLKRKIALLLWKLKEEGTVSKIKKVLG